MFSYSVTARGKSYPYVIPLQQEFLKKYFRFVLKNVEHKQLEKKVIITLF